MTNNGDIKCQTFEDYTENPIMAYTNNNCSCLLSNDESILYINCQKIDLYLEKLPDFGHIDRVIIEHSIVNWPIIPDSYKNINELNLANNKLNKIGNLRNLTLLKSLNLSINYINKLNPDICYLHNLVILDLSYNSIESFDFNDILCESVISKLLLLHLNNNKIKEISGFDLAIIGMSYLNDLSFRKNKIKSIQVNQLTQTSINILSNLKELFQEFQDYELVYENYINSYISINYDFSNNQIEKLHFNFKLIYSSVIEVYSIAASLLNAFSSINLKSNKVVCDCGVYDDVKFFKSLSLNSTMINMLSNSNLMNTICTNLNQTTVFEIFEMIKFDSKCSDYFFQNDNINASSIDQKDNRTDSTRNSSPNRLILHFSFFKFCFMIFFLRNFN